MITSTASRRGTEIDETERLRRHVLHAALQIAEHTERWTRKGTPKGQRIRQEGLLREMERMVKLLRNPDAPVCVLAKEVTPENIDEVLHRIRRAQEANWCHGWPPP